MNFNKTYESESFLSFLRNDLFPRTDFKVSRKEFDLKEFSLKKISSIKQIGISDKLDLAFYEMTHESENDPRVSITREAFRFMRDNVDPFTSNALIVFRSSNSDNYRFSLLTTDYSVVSKKIKKELSNPRRFSFFLGPDAKVRTPEQFLIKKGSVDSIEELKNRFSVEIVNKEFYLKIANLFYRFIKEANYPRENRKKEFAVKLIGRIIFCWFLKKKKSGKGIPLIPEELLSLRSLEKFNGYFHSVLEPLFFEVLNTPVEKRKIDKLLQISDYIERIPFLNGGLFDPDTNDHYSEMGASRGVITIEDQWFKDFFELLEMYNFTINESTPIDVELSIDPEMLGRIFENLLAEINPETGETARNATGSFYTPREIVEYMVDESIKHYLAENTTLGKEKIKKLVSWEEIDSDLNEDEIGTVISVLDKMKILDPACGSGAFPMGILHKIVHILEKIDENSNLWKEKIILNAQPQYRRMVRDKFKNEGPTYIHKSGLIENVIYGVDIQQIAVEISKLRVFLSLIVESSIDENKSNCGIQPLPNLEFKFVCADSLTKVGSLQMGLTENAKEIKELGELRELYFISFGEDKEHYKQEFCKTQIKLFEYIKSWVGDTSDIQKLANWDPFSIDKADFFDSKWMFGVEGFDIVIGNPPYIQLQNNHGILGEKYKDQGYGSFAKTGDVYALFYERGNELLKDGGHLCYITSNKWMRAKYGEKLRGYLSEKTNPKILIDFGGYRVFDSATVDTNILLFRKITHPNPLLKKEREKIRACKIRKDFKSSTNISLYFEKNSIDLGKLGSESWIISSADEALIKKKIEEVGTPLKEWDIKINYGIKTGFNKAFIIDGATKDQLIAEDPKSAEIIKPILRGRDIKKYKAEFADQWLINAHNGYKNVPRIDVNEYSAIKRHLDNYLEELNKRYDKGDTPYNLRNCAYVPEFEKEKIVWARLTRLHKGDENFPRFTYIKDFSFVSDSLVFISGKSIKYLLSVLNSKFGRYVFMKDVPKLDSGGFQMRQQYVEKLPVPQIPTEQQKPFETMVDFILFAKERSFNEAEIFEQVVDNMVYDLYFADSMKNADCYITDRIVEMIEPFDKNESDESKTEYIRLLAQAFKKDKTVQRCIIYSRIVKEVKTITGGGKDGEK